MESASGTDNPRAEFVLFAAFDGYVETEAVACPDQFGGVGIGGSEFFESASARRVGGGMRRIGIPLDEEGENAVVVVGEVERFPFEQPAVRTLAGTGIRTSEDDSL